MNDNFFDYVILGTGLQECIASSELSTRGFSILQLDREKSYGSDIRSLKYSELSELVNTQPSDLTLLSLDRSFNIDLTPKFLLAAGPMTKYLADQGIDSLVEFEKVGGNFMYQNGQLHFIPKDETSSLSSKLIGWLQKPYMAKFFWKVREYSEKRRKHEISDIETHMKFKRNMLEEFKHFSLNEKTREIVGHAIALNLSDTYLNEHPITTYEKIFQYIKSLVALNSTSPFIYPLYGLSELSQAFSRRAGMLGCIFMLNTPVIQIEEKDGLILESQIDKFDINTEIIGNSDNHTNYKYKLLIRDNVNHCYRYIYTNNIVSDSSYFPQHTLYHSTIITCIIIHKSTPDLLPKSYKDFSAHIIFLAKEMNRKNDVFMAVLGAKECVCPDGYSVSIISTVKEADDDFDKIFCVIKQKIGDVVDFFNIERNIRKGQIAGSSIIINDGVDQTTHFDSLFVSITDMLKNIETQISANKN